MSERTLVAQNDMDRSVSYHISLKISCLMANDPLMI